MRGVVANRWVLGQSSQLPQCSVTQFPCMSNTSQISYMGGGLRAPSPACQDPGGRSASPDVTLPTAERSGFRPSSVCWAP